MPHLCADQLNQLLSEPREWPQIESIEQQIDSELVSVAELSLFVPNDLNCFAGHFPGQAVLPGVVQVHWVGCLATLLFGLLEFQSLKSLKFNSMVLPETYLTLRLEYSAQKDTARFRYSNDNDIFSSGVMGFKYE